MKQIYSLVFLVLAISHSSSGQTIKLPFTGTDNSWGRINYNFTNRTWDTTEANFAVETYMGKESVFLQAGSIIYPKNIDFIDGIIEVDINFPDQRNFPGLAFRMQDINNCEHFYIGAQKSGKPDATRYTPLFNGQQAWQLYSNEGYFKAVNFKFNTWHHIKIDVHGLQADIYIDDMQTPLFKVPELKRDVKAGKIALFSDEAAVRFANAEYTPKQTTRPAVRIIPSNGSIGMITKWQVSNVVNSGLFENRSQLSTAIKAKLKWTTKSTDSFGILNFSRFATLTATDNTMTAKIIVESATEQLKALWFGFSDYITVYLNDKAVFYGADNYASRDYQFIATMGFFDKLFLPLKKGKNELWFVVSDTFGGWGVHAKFENMKNISLR